MKDIKIIYDDNHIIVIDKPSGLLSQGDISGDDSALEKLRDFVRVKYSKPGNVFIGLVHRLDRQVSGLMVFARTSKAAARLHKEFLKKDVEKYYIAEVENGSYSERKWVKLENNLLRIKDKTFISGPGQNNSQSAVLYYYPLLCHGDRELLLISLQTGRKHQIRAQLSGIKKPVYFDTKYGAKNSGSRGICLHSVYLSFRHPTQDRRIEFYSPPPHIFSISTKKKDSELKEMIMDAIREFRDQTFLSK